MPAIARFEQEGVILGYQAILNADKTGEDSVTAVIEVKITPERGGGFDRLAARIAQFDEVKSCYLMSGGYDLLVHRGGPHACRPSPRLSRRSSPPSRASSPRPPISA